MLRYPFNAQKLIRFLHVTPLSLRHVEAVVSLPSIFYICPFHDKFELTPNFESLLAASLYEL